MKKIYAFMLLILSVIVLVSCGGNGNNPTTVSTVNPNTTTTEPVTTTTISGTTTIGTTTSRISEQFTYDNTDTSNLPVVATTKIRIHYRRTDNTGNYENYEKWYAYLWDSQNGQAGDWHMFNKYDDFGVWQDVELTAVAGEKKSNLFGILIATKNWTKDVSNDRYVNIEATSPGGIQHIYLRQSTDKIFYTYQSATSNSVKYARMSDSQTIRVVFSLIDNDFVPDKSKFGVKIDGQSTVEYTIADYNKKSKLSVISMNNKLDITKTVKVSYKFSDDVVDEVDLLITNYFDSDEFVTNYTYNGDDLGVTFDNEANPTKTTFKVWAPTSTRMTLNLYDSSDYRTSTTPTESVQMTRGAKGVWSYTVNRDLSNTTYYTYTVTNVKGTHEVVDPYAKSVGLNGRRGMVVNFTKLNQQIANWASDEIPNYGELSDAMIYEIHVRDMTINPNSGVSENNRGKFLGLTETGTTYTKNGVTVKTGLDHLKELGITHVQIQPFYDYSSVDEETTNTVMSKTNYNWGYDPLNYNALEGSYSTDPTDGLCRIIEFKQMVMALHNAGIGITMDVVYNHTSSLDTSNFELLVPYYYHRFENNGSAYNGSGCGNEMASERVMVRKFMRESCEFWTEEYHLSGFRFDLMGLLDNQTMIDIYQDCKDIYSKVLVYGEPWTGGTSKLVSGTDSSKLSSQQTVQSSLSQTYFYQDGNYVGAFNDVIRNAVRGENNPGAGFVQSGLNAASILSGVAGTFNSRNSTINPGQVINYVSCHDNYTLYDQLVQTKGSRDLNKMYSQAEFIVFTSQGVAFMQEGEDFMRTKAYTDESGTTKYEGNSYNVGDYINSMDYELKVDNIEMFNFFKELIRVRKNTALLTLSTREEINTCLKDLSSTGGRVSYTLEDDNDKYIIIHTYGALTFELDGEYEVVLSNVELEQSSYTASITLQDNQSIILKRK